MVEGQGKQAKEKKKRDRLMFRPRVFGRDRREKFKREEERERERGR